MISFTHAAQHRQPLQVEKFADAPTLAGRRWLISFDHSDEEQIRPIPEDAGVMTLREMLSATGDLLLSIEGCGRK